MGLSGHLGKIARCAAIALAAALLAARSIAQSPEDLLQRRLPTPGPSKVLRSRLVPLPEDLSLKVPYGFRLRAFASGLSLPREMVTLPSGRHLVVESSGGRVRELFDRDSDGRADMKNVWVDGLERPYGIAVHGAHVYVANTDSVVRFPIREDGSAGAKETVIPDLVFAGKRIWESGHWTRDLLFSRDGKHLFLSVGSRSNVAATDPEGRAAILRYEADGSRPILYATGLRNPVSIALRPGSDEIWVTVNERDSLGNDLVPDYTTRVTEGAFYGWPFYYIGAHPDPRHKGAHPELAAKVVVPDVLIQAHSAPLGLAFYEGRQYPEHYRGGLFVCLHGSWNRAPLTGYKVVFIPFRDGKPSGAPEDFLTGFIEDASKGEVYGRPVAPLVLPDGSLLISDDEAGRVWRVAWEGTEDRT